MQRMRKTLPLCRILRLAVLAGAGVSAVFCVPLAAQVQGAAPAASAVHPVGKVKAIQGNMVTLASDAGPEVQVQIEESTRMVRALPGQKDPKEMTPMSLPDLQVGDRIVVRGRPAADGKSVVASSAIVMKGADVTVRQQQELEDWQKRGVGGLVSAVDTATGTITLSTMAMGGQKSVVIKVSKNTIVRRYAPDSVRFDDAKPGTLDEIKPGDQLRARGNRHPNTDETEVVAEEIVSGAFRNVAGTVRAIDTTGSTIQVMDLATKKPVTVKITADSQLKNLPPMVAQRVAVRLKGGAPEASSNPPGPAAREGASTSGGQPGGARPGGAPDLQQILNRMPNVKLADLQKGEAVMLVATQGSANSEPTAITLLTGVEPILTASPGGNGAAMLLAPWSLSMPSGEAGP